MHVFHNRQLVVLDRAGAPPAWNAERLRAASEATAIRSPRGRSAGACRGL